MLRETDARLFRAAAYAVVAIASHTCAQGMPGSRRPNVIIINIDNHDVSTLGFAGSTFIETPFGTKKRRYFDYIASGIPFAPIEKIISERVLPHMANTHTESNTSGRQITHYVEQAYDQVSRSLGAS